MLVVVVVVIIVVVVVVVIVVVVVVVADLGSDGRHHRNIVFYIFCELVVPILLLLRRDQFFQSLFVDHEVAIRLGRQSHIFSHHHFSPKQSPLRSML